MTTFGIKIIGFDFIQLQYIKITTVYLLGVLSICDNFWYQNHNLLSAKKVEKKARSFVAPFGIKIKLDYRPKK